MKLASVPQSLLALAVSLGALVNASPSAKPVDSGVVDIDGKVMPMEFAMPPGTTFRGPYKPGGEWVNLNGTMEEVYAQLLELNPNYENEVFPEFAAENEATQIKRRELDLQKRCGCNMQCGLPAGDRAPGSVFGGNGVSEGYRRLQGTQGYCVAPPGFAGCTRLACSWNAGITLCNDNSGYSLAVWCPWVGDLAWEIENDCTLGSDYLWTTKGQAFMSGNWNVFVRWEDC